MSMFGCLVYSLQPLLICLEGADTLALLFVMYSRIFCLVFLRCLGQVWYLIVLIPGLCILYLFFKAYILVDDGTLIFDGL